MKASFAFLHGRPHAAAGSTGIHRPGEEPARSCLLAVLFFALGGAQLLPLATARGAETGEVVAVYSSVSPSYARTPGPGGSFKSETYAFGEGGRLSGLQKDDTIDQLRFLEVARTIAPALAAKNYVPCDRANPGNAQLLIMVYWGATVGTDRTSSESQYQIAQELVPPPRAMMSPPPNGQGGTAMVSDPSMSGRGSEAESLKAEQAAADGALQESLTITTMANHQRDRQDAENAAILGYLPELQRVDAYAMTPLNQRRQDLVDEVEDGRYYVVLLVYDFQSLYRHKERKLLWETRFSIRQRHNDFSRQLAAMTQSAARFFGQNSNGLTRLPLPEGRVEYGELKVVGYDPLQK